MKNIILSLLLQVLCLSMTLNGQVDTIATYFNQTYVSDTALIHSHCVLPLDSHTNLIAGPIILQGGERMMYLRAISQLGETKWVKILDDEPGFAKFLTFGTQFLPGHEAGEFVLSYTREDIELTTNFNDIRVVSFDSWGNIIWTYDYDGEYGEAAMSMCRSADGGYAVLARLEVGTLPDDLILVKLDAEGNEQWIKNYSEDDEIMYEPYAVRSTPDGGFIISGRLRYEFIETDMFVIKTDSDGELEWFHVFEYPGLDYYLSVFPFANDRYVLHGGLYGTLVLSESFTGMMNSEGEVLWTNSAHELKNLAPMMNLYENEMGYLGAGKITAGTQTTSVVVQYNYDLEILWHKVVSHAPAGDHELFDFEATLDGSYLLCGITLQEGDSWVAKVDSLGNSCSQNSACQLAVLDTLNTGVPVNVVVEQDLEILVSPNPVDKVLQIQYQLPAAAREVWFRVFDLQGIEVRSKKLDANYDSTSIEFSHHLSSGLYTYRVENQGKVLTNGRLLKR